MQLLQACKEDLLKLDEDENAEAGLSHEQKYFCWCLYCEILKSFKQLCKLTSVLVHQGILTEILSQLVRHKRRPPWRGSFRSEQLWPTLQPSESGPEEDWGYPKKQRTGETFTVRSKPAYKEQKCFMPKHVKAYFIVYTT